MSTVVYYRHRKPPLWCYPYTAAYMMERNKLGQVLLRPAFSFSSALDFLAQGMTVQALFVLVHFHITPILFYISGRNMRTK